MTQVLVPIACLGVAALVSACASYHALPLPRRPDLAPDLAALVRVLPPSEAGSQPQTIDPAKPLEIDQIGLLAILNDPDLRSERGEMDVARAGLIQASLLPNPSSSLGYAALLGGPGTTAAYMASLSQDVASIVTYQPRNEAARAHVDQVNADLLWREWQVAQKARLLAFDLYWTDRSVELNRHELDLISEEAARVQAATSAGNLDITALAPLLAAKAAAEQALASLNLKRLKNWQALDALLGLMPGARFAISQPAEPPLPNDLETLIEGLPDHRPDLVALQLGYHSADANVRAAILGQFPAFVLGGTWNSDTTNVKSAGPNITFDLPIFNRNQGQIAQTRATRLLLREQYQSRLDSAIADIHGLVAQAARLSEDLVQARQAAASAESLAQAARAAYRQGNLDQRSLTDYLTTALQRQLEIVSLERSLGEDRITLAVELGLGLPQARLSPPDRMTSQ